MIKEREVIEPSPVAFHEIGHRLVGFGLNALVHITSIIPYGRTLGYNIITPDRSKSAEQQELDGLVFLSGGEAAEEAIGHTDHSGCTADRFARWRRAEKISRVFYGGRVAATELMDWGLSRARSIINGYGINYLKDRASNLMEKQVVF